MKEQIEETAMGSVSGESGIGSKKVKSTNGKGRLTGVLRIISNKYLITSVGFLVLILFFDGNNLLSRYHVKQELNQMYRQKAYYQKEITENEHIRKQLTHDLSRVEAYGRENYLMKRDNEDIFLIIEEKEEP
jgi:cell division protein DivIC